MVANDICSVKILGSPLDKCKPGMLRHDVKWEKKSVSFNLQEISHSMDML